MSEKIKFVTLPGRGKSVIATKFIKQDEIVLSEDPLVSAQFSWNKEYKYLCCDHCMLPLETAEENVRRLADDCIVLPIVCKELIDKTLIVPCSNCNVLYCSSKCQQAALSSYHNFECNQFRKGSSFYEIHELWKKSHYPPETATICLIIRIFGMIKNRPQTIELLDDFVKHSINEDLQICHKMLGQKFSTHMEELFMAIQRTFGGDEELARYTSSYEGFVSLLAILGTNSQGIGTSSFAHFVKLVSEMDLTEDKRKEADAFIDAIYSRFNDTVGEFLDNEGSGLYVKQSKINHSCEPNAQIIFPSSNFTLNVVALRDIKAEEELCISYIDECMLSRSRHSRQKYLQENYLFRCECEKCLSQINDPDETSDEEEMDTDDEH